MWIKRNVVMLPTNEKANIWLDNFGSGLYNSITNATGVIYQHLYILSDEEIKEGDWFFDGEYILQCSNVTDIIIDTEGQWSSIEECKKIIATTDKYLKWEFKGVQMSRMFELPEPSQSFIEYFVSEYNKGNIITEVMVEYEEVKYNSSGVPVIWSSESDLQIVKRLKTNPDNTLNINPVKNSWNRDEVIQFAKKYAERCQAPIKAGDKWIEENL